MIKDLLNILIYKANLDCSKVGKELGLSKSTICKWVTGVNPRYEKYHNRLIKLIKCKGRDIQKDVAQVKFILMKADNIKTDEWKDLILGLQEKLDITQFQLLDKLSIKRDYHVSEWINGKRAPPKNMKFKIIEFMYNLDLNTNKVISLGKNIRKSVKINKKWILVKELSQEYFSKSIIIKKNKKAYINLPLLFPKTRNGKRIIFALDKGKLIVFYKEKRSTRPTPLILPSLLGVNKDFLVGLGIYLGEGARNRHPKITNSEPIIINQGIKFFELFGINKKNLKAWIQLHERSKKSFGEVEKFWIKNTELNKSNITKIRIKKSSGRGNVKENGAVHLEVHSILFQLLINNLLDIIPGILKESSLKNIQYFLQGLFAAEGSVDLAKTSSVRTVSYCSVKDNERLLIKKLLNRFDICSTNVKERKEIRIFGFDNFKILKKLDIFKYHPERKSKLERGLKNLEIWFQKRNGKY